VAGAAGIDLNLLAVLGALLEHRNVTRAGEGLRLSQPTMSGALARLRQHFGDELLVRSGREYQLTPLASGLLPAVREALGQVERTLGVPAEFDPPTSLRRFSIAISAQSILALSGQLGRVHELAPGVRLDMWPITTTLMETGHSLLGYDVLIGPAGFRADGNPEVLLRDRIVYVADPANPRLRDGQDRFTVEDLARLPHAAARLPQSGLVTSALDRLGVTPRVVAAAAVPGRRDRPGRRRPRAPRPAGERRGRRHGHRAAVRDHRAHRGRLVAPHARHRPLTHLAPRHHPWLP
jgi:DNA-binding transcriptional LysR family regulator